MIYSENDIETFEIDLDAADKFRLLLDEKLICYTKLAIKLGMQPYYLSEILRKKKHLSRKVHQKLNDFLNTNY